MIANRVDPENGKAAGLSRSKLRLSKWAERYEQRQGEIRCPRRITNNARRRQGKRVQGFALDGALAAGGDESAAGAAGSDPGGAGRARRMGMGAGGLAAGGGARALGTVSAGTGPAKRLPISASWRG